MRLLLAVLVVGLLAPATAAGRVPLPPHPYVVHNERCPYSGDTDSGNCALANDIYLSPSATSDDLWHERGHVFDFQVLTPAMRRHFARLAGVHRAWRAGDYRDRLVEWFASSYAMCAVIDFKWSDRTLWYTPYLLNWHPQGRTLNRVCRLIRRVGGDTV